jgi:hypothetical protein
VRRERSSAPGTIHVNNEHGNRWVRRTSRPSLARVG